MPRRAGRTRFIYDKYSVLAVDFVHNIFGMLTRKLRSENNMLRSLIDYSRNTVVILYYVKTLDPILHDLRLKSLSPYGTATSPGRVFRAYGRLWRYAIGT